VTRIWSLHLGKGEPCVGKRTPKEPRNHIVLISDWDTVYGKDLSDTVARKFSSQDDEKDIDPKWISEVNWRYRHPANPNRPSGGEPADGGDARDGEQVRERGGAEPV
jgi:hypothetical protein